MEKSVRNMEENVKNIEFLVQKPAVFESSNAALLASQNISDQYLYYPPKDITERISVMRGIVANLPNFTGDMLHDASQFKATEPVAEVISDMFTVNCVGQRNQAGFITALTEEDLATIRQHKFLIVDLETTHLTKYSPPLNWSKSTKLGDKTKLGDAFGISKGEYIPASSATPRIRILSIGFPDAKTGQVAGLAWDMDELSDDDRLRLMKEVASAYCWIGQNLTFDLSWFAAYGIREQPRYILDSMLVVRDINPMLLHKMAESAADKMFTSYLDDEDDEEGESKFTEAALAHITKRLKLGKPSYAMTDIALSSDLAMPDKAWQKPVNWSIPSSAMRVEQYDYCMADVSDPLNIIRACLADYFARESNTDLITVFDVMPPEDILAAVFYTSLRRKPFKDISDARLVDSSEWKESTYYSVMKSSLIFAIMHGNGAPFDVNVAKANQDLTKQRIIVLANKVADNKHMLPFIDLMKSTSDGETEAMHLALRRAIHEHLEHNLPHDATDADMEPYEVAWDKTKNGKTSLGAKSLIITKVNGNTLDSIPFVKDFNKLRGEKKTYGMVEDYIIRARTEVGGNRLHSLVSAIAATSRTTSSEPNLQNVKRGAEARGQFKVVLLEDGRNALEITSEWLDDIRAWVKQNCSPEEAKEILDLLISIDDNTPRVVVASDFSAVEMRIAAALGERAWHEFNSDTYVSPYEKTLSPSAKVLYRKELVITRDLAKAYTVLDSPTEYIQDALNGKWTHDMPTVYRSDPARNDKGEIILDSVGLPIMCTSESSQESLLKYCFKVNNFSKPAEDYYYMNRIRLAWWASRVILSKGPVLSRVFANGIDPHLSTGLRMENPELDVIEYLLAMTPEERSKLKGEKKKARDSAKPVNFGLLYGLAALGLWRSGRVAYGLDWTLEEADASRSIWMYTYPELPFWHTWTRVAYRVAAKRPWAKAKFGGGGFDKKKSPVPFATTLTGRPLYGIQPQQVLNYQDQGSGAEIALRAIADLPEWLSSKLVLFVHDELCTEVPEPLKLFVVKIMEKTMIAAGSKILDLDYIKIPVDVETKYADHWEH
jgi:DNA polymerase-1